MEPFPDLPHETASIKQNAKGAKCCWKFMLIGTAAGALAVTVLFASKFASTYAELLINRLADEVRIFGWVYVHVAVLSTLAFSLAGYILGKRWDRMENEARALEQTSSQLRRMSITDRHTGMYVHNYIMERLEEEIRRAQRYAYPLSCLFLDIDNFKQLNDTYGHLFGDEVLSRVSTVMSAKVRDTDVLGRYGGDELLVILPHTDPERALEVAERIRTSIQSLPLTASSGESVQVTVSIGLYSVTGNQMRSRELIDLADHALRQAKQLGKNRTVVFSDSSPSKSAFPFKPAPPEDIHPSQSQHMRRAV